MLCGNIMEYFRYRGHRITILTTKSDATLSGITIKDSLLLLPGVNKKEQMETICYKIRWILANKINSYYTMKLIKATKPDVVYMHNLEWITFGPLNAAIKTGARVVLHAHNHLYDDFQNQSVEMISISKSISKGIKFIPQEHIHTIYNGIPTSAFIESNFTLPRPLKAIFAGSISSYKGLHVAIEAVIQSQKNGISIGLDIYGQVGNSEYLDQCKQLVASNNADHYISFNGPIAREELWTMMSESMMLLFPSLWEEPFGLVAAEAMANGAIVIGSNRGAIPEVVGDCGRCVEPTPEAIMNAIKEITMLQNDDIVLLRRRARERAMKMFLLEDSVAEIERILCAAP